MPIAKWLNLDWFVHGCEKSSITGVSLNLNICVLNRGRIKNTSYHIIFNICLSIMEWVGLDFIVMAVQKRSYGSYDC